MRVSLSILALLCLAAGWPADIPPLPSVHRKARGVTQGAGAVKLTARVVLPGPRTNTFQWRYPSKAYLAPKLWDLQFSTNLANWVTVQSTTNSAVSFSVVAPKTGQGFWRVKGRP